MRQMWRGGHAATVASTPTGSARDVLTDVSMRREDTNERDPKPLSRQDPATEAFSGEAEELAKDAVREMTGMDDPTRARDGASRTEDLGGPMIITDEREELGRESVDEEWAKSAELAPMRSN